MSDLSDNLDDLKSYYLTINNSELDDVFGSRFIKSFNKKNYGRYLSIF